jgi:hypothetical protein
MPEMDLPEHGFADKIEGKAYYDCSGQVLNSYGKKKSLFPWEKKLENRRCPDGRERDHHDRKRIWQRRP